MFALFTGGGDGKLLKWEKWQINQFIYTAQPYSCDYTDPAFIHAYDIRVVVDSRRDDLFKRRIVSAPPGARRQTQLPPLTTVASGSALSSRFTPKNSMTSSVFADSIDVLALGGQDHHIYIWGFDETDALLAKNADVIKVSFLFFFSRFFPEIHCSPFSLLCRSSSRSMRHC